MLKINYLLSLYSENDELILYRDLLLSFETIVMQRIEINNLEKNIKFKESYIFFNLECKVLF